MDAHAFLSKLKADGTKNDWIDYEEVFSEYKDILAKSPPKDHGPFSVNVLCILCRNLEKVPSWLSRIDNNVLVRLAISCIRETRCLNTSDKVKTLACIYHIHRHIVIQNSPVPSELVLKLSYMAFEDTLLPAYGKTYWNVMVDRITYIEKLKTKMCIDKFLPKLTEDIVRIIQIYNTVQFCTTVLAFLIKKLHFLFNAISSIELNKTFGRIFEEISTKNDLKSFKKLQDKEMLDVYVKLNDCLYVVAENSSKTNFIESSLNKVVQTCIVIVGHCPDLLQCLETIYLNGFCCIMTTDRNVTFIEVILNNCLTSFETSEKLGYTKAMTASYPYINQCLRLFIENLKTEDRKLLTEDIKLATLKLIRFLIGKLKYCEQILKCENCNVKTGLHDALRLSFTANFFITKENLNSKILSEYFAVVLKQYAILKGLCLEGCKNYEKCYKKLQTDVHNTAISLNKFKSFEYSIKLFEIYLKHEILHFKSENEMKNISRALYNKSICELDAKMYENALSDAYLSLIFAYPEGLKTEKYMSLVMDIKAKVLKSKDDEIDDETQSDELQMMTALDVCAIAVVKNNYGNLKPFFCDLKFSEILKHEFQMYAKLWPSIVPTAGIWRTLRDLTQHDVPWLIARDDAIQETLYEVILQTPSAIRSIQSQHYSDVVSEMIDAFHNDPPKTIESEIIYATLLLLKAEFDMTEASLKYGWKIKDQNMDPDQMQAYRTLSQEHEAVKSAIRAVDVWTELISHIDQVPQTENLRNCLQIIQVFVPFLLHLYKTLEGLQLAYVCCALAKHLKDKVTYLRNAGTIIYHANKQTDEIMNIITIASEYCAKLIQNSDTLDTALIFLCDCAIFYNTVGLTGMAGKLVQTVQAKIINSNDNDSNVNLNLATGRLMEAQAQMNPSGGPSTLTSVIGAHRHHLTVPNTATKYTSRRLMAYTLKLHITYTGLHSATFSRELLSWRRARSAAAATLPAVGSVAQGILYACICNCSLLLDAQVKIDNHLKNILGLKPSTDQPLSMKRESKPQVITSQRQDLEIMLENMTLKTQANNSPSVCYSVPRLKIPQFLTHTKCDCYACANKYSLILACKTIGLEASMYFRASEFSVAKNYFDGALKCCYHANKQLKCEKSKNYERFIVDLVHNRLYEDVKKVEIEILIEAAFCKLAQSNFKSADEYVVRIHEILQENVRFSPYLKNEVHNLMMASANLKKETNKTVVDALELEFESLKLSPVKKTEPPKTPEVKAVKPPVITHKKVKDEEVPNTKRKVIKLNLDEGTDEIEKENTRRASKRTEFKIPVPVTVKPVLESIQATPKRRVPKIIVTQPTPSPESTIRGNIVTKPVIDLEYPDNSPSYHTPKHFFTPISNLKTYTKKYVSRGIVKNLESEFSTPKSVKKQPESSTLKSINKDHVDQPISTPKEVDQPSSSSRSVKKTVPKLEQTETNTKSRTKANSDKVEPNQSSTKEMESDDVNKTKARNKSKLETGLLKAIRNTKALKRSTSPGKLEKKAEKKVTRSGRLRRHVKLSLDEDDLSS